MKNNLNIRKGIISVARKMFYEKGYKKTSLSKIAKKLGISINIIHLYFKNKDELYFNAFDESERFSLKAEVMAEAFAEVLFESPKYKKHKKKIEDFNKTQKRVKSQTAKCLKLGESYRKMFKNHYPGNIWLKELPFPAEKIVL